jgi:hypothetical protein
VNRQGKSPVMIRLYLNNKRITLGTSGISVSDKSWDAKAMKVTGKSAETLQTNKVLNDIQADLQYIFRKIEYSDNISLERIKSEYKGKIDNHETILDIFKMHNDDIKVQVGITKSSATLQKYENCRRHFKNFIMFKFNRSDLYLKELKPLVIHDFEIYLLSIAKCSPNTAT